MYVCQISILEYQEKLFGKEKNEKQERMNSGVDELVRNEK